MNYFLIGSILSSAAFLFSVAIAVALVIRYLQTKNVGFLWMCGAVFVWPRAWAFLGRWIISRVATKQPMHWFPANVVQQGKMTIGAFVVSFNSIQEIVGMILLFVAIIYLGRRPLPPPEPVL